MQTGGGCGVGRWLCKNWPSSAALLTTEFQTASGSNISIKYASASSWNAFPLLPCTQASHSHMQCQCWSGIKHTAMGLWSSVKAFFVAMNHTSLSGCLMDKSDFGRCHVPFSVDVGFSEHSFQNSHDMKLAMCEWLYLPFAIICCSKFAGLCS